MNNKFMASVEEAHKQNEIRQEKLAEHFFQAVDHEADILGCGRECRAAGRKAGKGPAEIFMECCNDGVIRVDFTTVNTAAIIENEYGDMENMT